MMDKSSPLYKNALIMSVSAGIFSLLAMAALSTIPIQEVDALDCAQVDASRYGECDIDRDTSDDGFRDCNVVRCTASQTVFVQNSLNSNEEAKINIDLEQLLNCGNPNCLNNANQQEAFNVADQEVDVRSGGSSIVDFDVDMEMSQKSDGENDGAERVFAQDNLGYQGFFITASNNAFVDVDGDDNDAEFVMDQFNDRCTDTTCTNDALQYYDLVAQGRSIIDVSSDTGFEVNQLNDGCDDADGFQTDVTCTNISEQGLDIDTLNPTSGTNRASVTWDTLDRSTTVQENDCRIGINLIDCTNEADSYAQIVAGGSSIVDVDDAEQDTNQLIDCDQGSMTCDNNADSFISIGTRDTSRVNIDAAEQDVEQSIECGSIGDDIDCGFNRGLENEAVLNLAVAASLDGVVNAEGSQVADQSINCVESNCENHADMFVGLGFNPTTSGADDVTGTLNSEYSQLVHQEANCNDDANCNNLMTMYYFATALDGSIVNSESDQQSSQITNCDDRNCNNVGTMTNNVFASNTARLNADSTQSLTQLCDNTSTGSCNNTNFQTTNTRAIGTAQFTTVTSQTVNNGPGGGGDGTQNINLQRSTGTHFVERHQTDPNANFVSTTP